MISESKGDSATAIGDLGLAIRCDPRPAALYFERAALRKDKGDTDRALTDLSNGLALEPDNVAALMARAQITQSKGDTAAAIADYDAALKRDPNNAAALNARASGADPNQELRQGHRRPRSCHPARAKNAQAYFQRGAAFEQSGQRAKAIDDYTTALARDGSMTVVRDALARATAEERRQQDQQIAEQNKKQQEMRLAEQKKIEADAALKAAEERRQQDLRVAEQIENSRKCG